ncbi:hypothetical protein [Streptomyces sp. 6N223]|uniref:hypothetical protein n=1 Tax=Streptomyces sp. 6N223 TaxID=3457412 RepID=UPI003FD117B3
MLHFFDHELHRARAADLQGRAEDYRRARRLREALRRERNAGEDAVGNAGPAAPSRDDRPDGGWTTAA